jgi:hypothetical protein
MIEIFGSNSKLVQGEKILLAESPAAPSSDRKRSPNPYWCHLPSEGRDHKLESCRARQKLTNSQ